MLYILKSAYPLTNIFIHLKKNHYFYYLFPNIFPFFLLFHPPLLSILILLFFYHFIFFYFDSLIIIILLYINLTFSLPFQTVFSHEMVTSLSLNLFFIFCYFILILLHPYFRFWLIFVLIKILLWIVVI